MSEKRLLFSLTKDDFKVEAILGTGPGGQNRNKTATAIRITHPASGAVGFSQSDRSQLQNKRLAFKHLVESPKFKTWHKLECARRLSGKTIEQVVEKQLAPGNIKIEVVDVDGKWIVEGDKVVEASK